MLITKRCKLVRFQEKHIGFYRNLQSNVQVRQYLGGVPTKEHIEKNISRIMNDSSSDDFVVEDVNSNDHMIQPVFDHSQVLLNQNIHNQLLCGFS